MSYTRFKYRLHNNLRCIASAIFLGTGFSNGGIIYVDFFNCLVAGNRSVNSGGGIANFTGSASAFQNYTLVNNQSNFNSAVSSTFAQTHDGQIVIRTGSQTVSQETIHLFRLSATKK